MKQIKNLVNNALKKANLDRFSFAQMTSNSDGKTSGSGSMGVFTIAVGLLTFLMGATNVIFFDGTGMIMTQSIVIITIGTGLLGYRKSKDGKVTKDAVTAPHDEYTEDTPVDDMSGGDEQLNS